jgi:hypothetical protein
MLDKGFEFFDERGIVQSSERLQEIGLGGHTYKYDRVVKKFHDFSLHPVSIETEVLPRRTSPPPQ